MSDCRKCVDCDWCAEHEECDLFKPKAMTNADRIRSMSDEELADYLICDIEAEAVRRTGRMLTSGEIDRAVADCIDWLKQESTNEST